MKYRKIKDSEGDFVSFEPGILHLALIEHLGEQGDPQRWYLSTSACTVSLIVRDKSMDLDGVDKIFRDHFKIDWSNYDSKKKEKDKQVDRLMGITTIAGLKVFIEEELL